MQLTTCVATGDYGKSAQCGPKFGFQRKNTGSSDQIHFCPVSVVQKKTMSGHQKSDASPDFSLKGTLQADATEHYGRRKIVRIFGVTKESDEDIYQKLVDVPQGASVVFAKEDFNVCQILPTLKTEPKAIVATFLRRQVNNFILANNKN